MAENQFMIGVGVADRVMPGINSVLSHLQRNLPGGISIAAEVTGGKQTESFLQNLGKSLRDAAGDADRTAKALKSVDDALAKKNEKKYGDSYMTDLWNDTQKALHKLKEYEIEMERIAKKSKGIQLNKTNEYGNLKYVIDQARIGISTGDRDTINRVLADQKTNFYSRLMSELRAKGGVRELPESLEKLVKEYERRIASAVEKAGNSAPMKIQKVLNLHGKDKEFIDIINRINSAASKIGIKSPIADTEQWINYLVRAKAVLDSINARQKEAVLNFGKDDAKGIVSTWNSYKRQLMTAVRGDSPLYLRDFLMSGQLGATKLATNNMAENINIMRKPGKEAEKLEQSVTRLIEKAKQMEQIKGIDLSKTIAQYEHVLRLANLAKQAIEISGSVGATRASQYLLTANQWLENANFNRDMSTRQQVYDNSQKRKADKEAELRVARELREEERRAAQEAKDNSRIREAAEKRVTKARQEQQKISKQINAITSKGALFGKMPEDNLARKLRSDLMAVNRALDDAIAKMHKFASNPAGASYKSAVNEVNRLTAQANGLLATYNKNDKVRNDHAKEYHASLEKIKQSMQSQSFIAADLRSQLMGMYSIYQAQSFLRNIVEIGGQFEYQRASIAKILEDAGKANVLFDKIKGMALRSPFSTLELDQYTKMLSAFNVEYNEIYGKLQLLGDISAATGTDMSRIIYAYGHVRSQGFMNAMQMRMFTNANIPMLTELQKLYSKREGEGVKVSRAQVYEMLKSRQVEASDVDEVLNNLAGPGGKFYRMQEVMASTVKGTWKNLGDAINHMYLAIENQNDGKLKWLGETLTTLTKSLPKILPLLSNAAIAFGLLKTAQLSLSAVTGKELSNTIRAISLNDQKRLSVLRLAESYRTLTQYEKDERKAIESANWRNGVTAGGIMRAFRSGDIKKADIYRGMHTGSIGAQASLDLWNKGFIKREDAVLANSSLDKILVKGKQVVTLGDKMRYSFRSGLNAIVLGAREAAASMKLLWSSVWPMLVMTAIFEAIRGIKEWGKEVEETLDKMRESSSGASKSLSEVIKEYVDDAGKLKLVGKGIEEYNTAISEFISKLKDNAAQANAVVSSIMETCKSAEERVKALAAAAENAKYAADKLTEGGNYAAIEGGSYFTDNIVGFDNFQDDVDELNTSHRKLLASLMKVAPVVKLNGKAMNAARNASKTYSDAIKNLKDDEEGVHKALLMMTADRAALNAFKNELVKEGFDGKYNRVGLDIPSFFNNDFGDVEKRLDNAMRGLYETLDKSEQRLINPKDANAKGVEAGSKIGQQMLQGLTNVMNGYGVDEVLQEQFIRKFANKYHIVIPVEFDYSDAESSMMQWQMGMSDVFGNQKYTTVIKAAPDYLSARKAASELWKNAKDSLDKLKKIKLIAGMELDFSNLEGAKKRLEKRYSLAKDKSTKEVKDADKKSAAKRAEIYRNAIEVLEAVMSGNKAFENGEIDDLDNDGKKNKGSQNNTDKQLAQWKKEIEQINDVRDAYEDLKKTRIDDAAAMRDLLKNNTYADTVKKFFPTISEINEQTKITERDFAAAYRKMAKKIDTLPGRTNENKENRLASKTDAEKRATKSENQFTRDQTSDAIKSINLYLESEKKAYDYFMKIYNATGDVDLANRLAGNYTVENDVERAKKVLDAKIKLYNESVAGDENAIKFDKIEDILGMSEEKLASLSPDIASAYKSWREEIERLAKTQQDALADMLANRKDYASELERIRVKYEAKEIIIKAQTEEGAERDKLLSANKASENWEKLQLSAEYANFMSGATVLSAEVFKSSYDKILETVSEAFSTGAISAKQYEEAIKKLNEIGFEKGKNSAIAYIGKIGTSSQSAKILKGLTNGVFNPGEGASPFRSFFAKIGSTLGVGLMTTLANPMKMALRGFSVNEMLQNAQLAADNAQRKYDEDVKMYGEDSDEAEESGRELEARNDELSAMQKFSSGLNAVAGTLAIVNGFGDGLAAAFKDLAETFYSFGNKKTGDVMGNIADGIDGAFSVMDPVSSIVQNALSGNISGVVASVIEAPVKLFTGPITAFNKLHDKIKSQRIEDRKIELNTLQTGLGILQRSFSRGFGVQADNSAEQLRNLKAQKENIESQLRSEEGKKNKDQGAIDGYIDKIDELQDKIANFTADLAKTLYGIDLKDWAGQLSDAMVNAFRNGEDAALAWRQKVGDLIRQVTGEYIKQNIVMKAIEPIYDKYFKGINGEEPVFGPNLENLNEKTLAQFGTDLNNALSLGVFNGSEKFWDYVTTLFPDSTDDGGSAGLSKIGQSLTEDTGSLLASYVNSIRADLTYNRGNIELIKDALHANGRSISTIADAQLQQLQMIKSDTTSLVSILNEVTAGTKKIAIQ